jgi:hypothetical protein
MAFALAHELQAHGATAVPLTPGWLRSEAMLEAYGVAESNWRDATTRSPHFAISESPAFVGRAVVALALDPNVPRWSDRDLKALRSSQLVRAPDRVEHRQNLERQERARHQPAQHRRGNAPHDLGAGSLRPQERHQARGHGRNRHDLRPQALHGPLGMRGDDVLPAA